MSRHLARVLALIWLFCIVGALASDVYWHNERTGKTQWEEPKVSYKDVNGNTYYLDPETGESTWTKPAEIAWTAAFSEEHNREYYYNEVTQESIWEKPEALAWQQVEAPRTEL